MYVNQFATDSEYVVELAMPGIRKETVTVTYTPTEGRYAKISVAAARKPEERTNLTDKRAAIPAEYDLDLLVPGMVDPDTITVDYADGILTLLMGLGEKWKPRKIALS